MRRTDLVRVKEGAKAGVDKAVLARVLATTCALSHRPLANPVVSDSLGRLYNKDSVVKYLLTRSEEQKRGLSREDKVAGHLRGLKDVQALKLVANPSASRESVPSSSTEEEMPAPFVCPLTQREMNGKHRFVYLAPCGCVMSESGLRAVVKEQTSEENVSGCPVCGTPFAASSLGKREIRPGGDVVILNGTVEELEAIRQSMEKKREIESARRKELKGQSKGQNEEDSEAKREKREEKRKRKEEVVKLLQAEEKRAKREDVSMMQNQPKTAQVAKEMSAAVRSIYGLDKPKATGETWMTRGTFNRFA